MGLFRRLAVHLVLNNFLEPQCLEGLEVDLRFFADPHDISAIIRFIATSTMLAREFRGREAAVRAAELRTATSAANVANAFYIKQEWVIASPQTQQRGHKVIESFKERSRFVRSEKNAGSLVSLRSGSGACISL